MAPEVAYITKADDRYYPGAVALAASLRCAGVSEPLIVFNAGLSRPSVDHLQRLGCVVTMMPIRHFPRQTSPCEPQYNESIFALMHLADLKVGGFVHLDADAVVFDGVQAISELLQEADFVGVPDHPTLTVAENVGDHQELSRACRLLDLSRSELVRAVAVNAGVFASHREVFVKLTPVMQRVYDSKLKLPRRDQTLLNLALAAIRPTTVLMSVEFNFRHLFRRDPELTWSGLVPDGGLLRPHLNGSCINVLHYVGERKPWQAGFDRESEAYRLWRQFWVRGDQ